MAKTKASFDKLLKDFYKASDKKARIINVPKYNFLMVDGKGFPQKKGGEYQEAIQALYNVAYTLKFSFKFKEIKRPKGYFDYRVPALGTLWWMKGDKNFSKAKKSDWRWTAMILQPDFIKSDHIKAAAKILKERKKDVPALIKVKLKPFKESLSVQILHIGSYTSEERSVKKLMDFVKENNYKVHGKHHEIYLSDPRRVPTSKLKTVIRLPIRK